MTEAKEMILIDKQRYQDLLHQQQKQQQQQPETSTFGTQTEDIEQSSHSQESTKDDEDDNKSLSKDVKRPLYAVRTVSDEVPGIRIYKRKTNKKLSKIKWISY